MSSGREAGWGAYEKAQRYRQVEESRRIVKPDANDPFVFKRPKQNQPQPQPQSQSQPAQPQPTQQQHHHHQPQPQPIVTPTAASTPVASTPTTTSDEVSTPYSTTHASASQSSPSPTSSSASVNPAPASSSTGHQILCSVLVELFEMVSGSSNPAPKAFGPKGVTLQRLSTNVTGGDANVFQLLVYAPVSKKVEFSVDVTPSFQLTILPDRFASFDDVASSRSWCIKFGSSEDAFNLARCFALINETRSAAAYAKGGTRGILKQDLTIGTNDGPTVQIGDQIKCKYSVYAYDPAQPFYIGRVLFALRDSAKYIVGAGSMLPGVEESLIGMRKRSTRMLIIPSVIAESINQQADWGPHVKAGTTLIVECTVSNIRSSIPVNGNEEANTTNETHEPPTTNTDDGTLPASATEPSQSPSNSQQAQQAQSSPSSVPYHLQPSSSNPSAPYPQSAAPTISTSNDTPVDDSESEGVYNPNANAGLDLKTRMALLANAGHTGGLPVASSASAPVSTAASSIAAAASGSGRRESFGSASYASVDELEQFLTELGLMDLLPAFKREGVGMAELQQLDQEELKQLVPLMGPRRRIMGRLVEWSESKRRSSIGATNAPSVTTAATNSTPSAANSTISSPFAASSSTSTSSLPSHHSSPSTSSKAPQSNSLHSVRSRFLNDGESDAPTSSVSSASAKHFSQLHSQSQLESLLASEYERGQADTIALAKNRIADMKETAQSKFQQLQATIDQERAQKEQDREKAREMVQRLREEVRTLTQSRDSLAASVNSLTHEKDSLQEKSQKYISQLKEKLMNDRESMRESIEKEIRDQEMARLKANMEQLYLSLHSNIKPSVVYDGDEILTMVKSAIKNTMKNAATPR